MDELRGIIPLDEPLTLSDMRGIQGAKMSEAEFREHLNRYGLSVVDACTAVYFETEGVVIKPETISKAFDRGSSLSGPLSGVFRMLFKQYGKRNRYGTKAA